MKFFNVLLLCTLLAFSDALTRGQDAPTITGFVTRAVSASDFDVNGLRVLCNMKTRDVAKSVPKSAKGAKDATVACPGDPPYVGEGITVQYNGVINDSILYATRIERRHPPRLGEVSGSAVIDAPPESTGAQAYGLTVRADGYQIRITSETKIEWTPPLKALADVKAGEWIKYKGKLTAAGVVETASVEIGPNTIGSSEEKLREKSEYDPSAAPTGAKHNHLKNALTMSYDPKEYPPFNNAAMQARTEKIGSSLVPAYQRALADSDPAKIHFRFQVVDNKHFCGSLACEAYAMPSGIIQVPHQIVERMQNDSQLAAVLADGIACALERQTYRNEGKIRTVYASTAAAAFVPYVRYGAGTGFQVAEDIQTREMRQRDRVSLWLLHDAGYDIDQAPMAWWLLALDPKSINPMEKDDVPDRTAYLYGILGETWHNPAANTSQAH